MICIVGANGSMGTRYKAILDYLDEPYRCFDKETEYNTILKACTHASGVILCTPTDTHSKFLHDMITVRVKRILCEKPIVKDPNDLADIYYRASHADVDLKMMFQYTYHTISPSHTSGDTFYDYFRHGNDGLVWDCLQIIGLAKGDVKVYEESPIWKCVINGHPVNSRIMDRAYVWFVNRWLNKTLRQDPKEIIRIHQKVDTFAKERDGAHKHTHRHSS